MKTAKQKFKIGDKVIMTRYGLRCYGKIKISTGKVVGYSRSCWRILIRRQGYKSNESWCIDFWKAVK